MTADPHTMTAMRSPKPASRTSTCVFLVWANACGPAAQRLGLGNKVVSVARPLLGAAIESAGLAVDRLTHLIVSAIR